MTISHRIDRAEIRSYTTQQGYLRADAWLTRSGVFSYRNSDGTLRREYRPDSEVFDAPSLDTLQLVAVTDDHPPIWLDSANTKSFAVGKVGQDITQDGRWVRATVQVDDEIVQQKIRDGKVELSAGYEVEFDPTPGVTPEGLEYDGIQRNIRYNHLSVVERGRASDGLERAALKLDAALQSEHLETPTPHRNVEEVTMKLKINGERFDAAEELADALQAEREAVQAKLDAEQARADAAEDKAKGLEKELAAANDSAKFDAAVRARVSLERESAQVLDSDDLAGMSDREIREAVVAKLCPEAKLDSVSDAYLAGRFDHAMEERSRKAQEQARKDADEASQEAAPSVQQSIEAARKARAERLAAVGNKGDK